MLGGCQGTTGPASLAPDGSEWGARFPFTTIRDQVNAQAAFSDAIGIDRWAAVIGGSMGGMQALEWAVAYPGARRAARGHRRSPALHRRPDRAELGADRGGAHRPALPRRPLLRRRGRRRPAPRPRPRAPDGPAQLPQPVGAERTIRARLAERDQPARRRRPLRRRVVPRLPRQQVHPALRRQQLHHAGARR